MNLSDDAKRDLLAAKAKYQKAIARGASDFHTFQLYGFLLIELEEYPEAIEQLTGALAIAPSWMEAAITEPQLEYAKMRLGECEASREALIAYQKQTFDGELPKPFAGLESIKIVPFGPGACALTVPVFKNLTCYYKATKDRLGEWRFEELIEAATDEEESRNAELEMLFGWRRH